MFLLSTDTVAIASDIKRAYYYFVYTILLLMIEFDGLTFIIVLTRQTWVYTTL